MPIQIKIGVTVVVTVLTGLCALVSESSTILKALVLGSTVFLYMTWTTPQDEL